MKPLLAIPLLLMLAAPVHALIMVHKGNDPTQDQNWPDGSVNVANLKTRAGFWEGPPFGGGRYVFEYQGDNAALQDAIDLFAKVKSPELRVIIHDGRNKGFFCGGNDKDKDAPGMDWSFTVWTPENFHRLYSGGNREIISAADPSGNLGKAIEPPTIDVYLGAGRIDWKQIKLPPNLKVTDERATAAGYAPADGSVCRGQVFEMVGSKPLAGATVRIDSATAKTDADGKFESKNVPPGSHPIIVTAPGHASRVIGYASFATDTLKQYTVQLAPAARVAGIVKDQSGQPVPNATVRADGIVALDGSGYILPERMEVSADAEGKFEMTGLPAGTLHFYTYTRGFAPLDVLTKYKAPADQLELRVTATGTIKGRVVDATGKPDPTAQIAIYPEGGSKAGKWSASGNLDANAAFSFDSVPPGRYVVSPFPGRQFTNQPDPAAKTVEVKAGQTTQVEVTK
ncbi:MAG TPA: carboxypeptidase regulatory-like domain-containing protein [Tepidisphaeraceae bacterium]|jgi:hypothetical protein